MLQQINAEEIGGDCGNKISCRDCLDDDTSTCGWVPVEGCLKSCNIIADADCYNIQDFNSDNNNMTGDDICIVAENDMADMNLCNSLTNCTSCVETNLVSDTYWNTCQWFQDGNYCSSGCGMVGCGETICSADSISINNNGSDNMVVLKDPSSSVESSSIGGGTATTSDELEINNNENNNNNNNNVDDIDNAATTTTIEGTDLQQQNDKNNDAGEGISSTGSQNSAMIHIISTFWAINFVLVCLIET